MKLIDMNQSWKVPEGYRAERVKGEGAFLRITYTRPGYDRIDPPASRRDIVEIFLNDQGREVVRVERAQFFPLSIDWNGCRPDHVKTLSLWERIKLWWRVSVRG